MDPEEIKQKRKSRRIHVTASQNRLTNLLAKEEGNDIDHKVISPREVKQVEEKLHQNFELFSKLHERYCEIRAAGKDDAEEQKLVEKDADYLKEVASKVYPLLDQLDSYHKSLAEEEARQAKVKSIPMHQQEFDNSAMNYKVTKQKALELIQCLGNLNPDEISEESNIQSQLTEIVYEEILKKDFDAMDAKAAELRNALEARGDNDKAVKEIMKFERLEELTSVTQIRRFLRKILYPLKFRDEFNIKLIPEFQMK